MRGEDLTGLGRLSIKDPADKAFPLMAPQPRRGVRARTWYVRGVLDQGATSECVQYSTEKYCEAHPVKNDLPLPRGVFYKECQKIDAWPGEDYDGTSVRAAFKLLKRFGLVSEYRWAWDSSTVVNHILTTGPIVLGTEWFYEMFAPDRNNFIRASGERAGGHAYLGIGVNLDKQCPGPDGSLRGGKKGAIRILNSWGNGWADNGRAWMSLEDLDKLLDLDGEACVATEIPRAT